MAPPPPRRSLPKRLLFSLVATVGGLAALELGARLLLPAVAPDQHHAILTYRHRWFPRWDPSPVFEPHPYLAYVLVAGEDGVNADGFTFDPVPRDKPPGVFRVAAIGGSTTVGSRAWPELLARRLEQRRPGLEVQALNFGMSGWTSAESAVNYVLNVQDYAPDVVVVHHGVNDLGAMLHTDFHPDYRHYRRVLQMDADEQGRLRLRQRWTYRLDARLCRLSLVYVWARIQLLGEGRSEYSLTHLTTRPQGPRRDVPEAARGAPFLRNLRTIGTLAEANGSRVVFASIPWVRPEVAPELAAGPGWSAGGPLPAQNARMLAFARDHGWGAVDLDAELGERAELFVDAIHMNGEGQAEKAALIARFIEDQGWLPPAPGGAP